MNKTFVRCKRKTNMNPIMNPQSRVLNTWIQVKEWNMCRYWIDNYPEALTPRLLWELLVSTPNENEIPDTLTELKQHAIQSAPISVLCGHMGWFKVDEKIQCLHTA